MLSDVQNFYAGKTIFITGATGFLGQILLSKLLCSCPEISCIYILVREKKGKYELNQRLKEIFDDPIFQRAKEIHRGYETKVKAIKGDCGEYDLGISEADRAIIENEVEIIFHVAATVKFNAPLRKSAMINIQSLNVLLKIAKKIKHLKVFMHVSTAFSPCAGRKLIEEKFYDPPLKAHKLISLIENLNDSILDKISPSLITPNPNNYIFTKLIAEDLCREQGSELPLCIFRPSIVTSCYKEPLPGWINSTCSPSGPVGIALGHALGVMKVVPVDKALKSNIAPGDYTINALILAAYFGSIYWQSKSSEESKLGTIPIINYSNSTNKFEITWGTCLKMLEKAAKKYPFYNMVTLPRTTMCRNLTIYRILTVIFHVLPAAIFDLGLAMVAKKPKFKKMYQKLHDALEQVVFFTTQEWIIPTNKIEEIWTELSDKDKEIFYCNMNDLNFEHYFDVLVHGVRLYLAKDDNDTILKAVQKRKIFLVLYCVVVTLLVLLILYVPKKNLFFIPSIYLL